MSCNLNLSDSKLYAPLKKRFTTNESKMYAYYSAVTNNGEFKEDFQNYVKEKRKTDKAPTVNDFNSRTIVNDIISYYNRQVPDGNDTIINKKNNINKDYNSVADRTYCVKSVANTIVDLFRYKRYDKHDYSPTTKQAYEHQVRSSMSSILANRYGITTDIINANINIQAIKNRMFELMNDGLDRNTAKQLAMESVKLDFIAERMPNDAPIPDINLLATVREMCNSTMVDGKRVYERFFDEVFMNQNLDSIRKEFSDEFKSKEEDKAQEEEDIALGENSTSEEDDVESALKESYDVSFRVFENHSGLYSTFTTHIGDNIKNYFNSLPKLLSTAKMEGDGSYYGQYYQDKDTPNGIADKMSANECSRMLYSMGDFTTVSTMIESVKKIAEQIPDFQAFIKFYDDLTKNHDFAYEVYETFGKMVISKKETYVVSGEPMVRITNTTADKVTSLRFEYFNSLRTSTLNNYTYQAENIVKNIQDKINEIEKLKNKKQDKYLSASIDYSDEQYEADVKAIRADVYNLLRLYLPTISSASVINYTENNKSDDFDKSAIDNIYSNTISLLNISKSIIDNCKQSYDNYTSNVVKAQAIKDKNKLRKKSMMEFQYQESTTLEDPNSVWEENPYMTDKNIQDATALATMLVKYSVVKTELNSRNAKGNLSSDVINSNFITGFINMLQSDLNYKGNKSYLTTGTKDNIEIIKEGNTPLLSYRDLKFATKQYINSNILVEKKDEHGEIINIGMFRYEGGKYVPTEYATDIVKAYLFNGSSDFNNGNTALYPELSKGDYITTSLIQYFESKREIRNSLGSGIATDYFFKTPSDAPKNFIFSAPCYSLDFYPYDENGKKATKVSNFWTVKDEGKVTERVSQILSDLKIVSIDDDNVTMNSQQLSDTQGKNIVTDLLANGKLDSISVTEKTALSIDKTTGKTYLNIKYGKDLELVIEGTLNKQKTELTNVSLYGVVANYGDNFAWNIDDKNDITKALKNKIVKGDILLADGSKVEMVIDRRHPIFKQYFYAFKQEMQNAATAIDTMFTHQNGRIIIEEGENRFKPTWSDKWAGFTNKDRVAYDNYHKKKNKYKLADGREVEEKGIVQKRYIKNKDGEYEESLDYRLSGNVFTSDRFTIFDEETEEKINFLQEVLDEGMPTNTTETGKINFLYGGANNSYLHINNNGEVEFTEAQQQLIEDKLEEFIIAYCEQGIDRILKHKNIIPAQCGVFENSIDRNKLTEFLINYHLAYINSGDIFEGDSKFYKGSQDQLKRIKETQGGGTPYALYDSRRQFIGDTKVAVEGAALNNPEFQAIVGKLHDCKQYTTFKGITVVNIVKTDVEAVTNLTEELTKNFINQGLSKADAEDKAKTMMDGYKNVKTNDAQSYITFEEWIRRIAAKGQLYRYKSLIERILDESTPLDVSDIEEFIQVQKNFYYDMHYNPITNTCAPRQIKNAEFVLVPRFIKGTTLEHVYNSMIKFGIDQLNTEETSKAGKANVFELWTKDGKLNKNWFVNPDNFSDKNEAEYARNYQSEIRSGIETYNYNNLYTQQETPNHLNSENKAGLQIMKKILDNIDKDSKLYPIKQRFLENYSQNIYESFEHTMSDLGVELDENGNIKLDEDGRIKGLTYEQLFDKIKDEMIRLGVDSNMLDYVTMKDNDSRKEGEPNNKMPFYLNSHRRKIENICQAVFNNKITRQKLHGFHAAQITQAGWKSPYNNAPYKNKKTNKRISVEEYRSLSAEEKKNYRDMRVGYSKELRYHPKNETTGKVERYIEIMLPASNFGFDIKDKKYDNLREQAKEQGWSTAELEDKIHQAMLAELQLAKADMVIGYRIPTEGKQSVCAMKVVGFISDGCGSTIVVPDGWVAQTGSDFDIDSVYGIQYELTRNNGILERIKYSENSESNYIRYVNNKLTDEEKEQFWADYIKDNKDISDKNKNKPRPKTKEESKIRAKETQELKTRAKENLLARAKVYAKDKGLIDFDTYIKKSYAIQNSRAARNNQILEDMFTILQSDEALEENLSQSQFKDIIDARDAIMNPKDKARRASRSLYNFLDNADYQEDAMSGAKLKGFSVSRDSFLSICNTVKPKLNKSITIIYKGDNNKFKKLQKRFDTKDDEGNWVGLVKKLPNNKIEVKHTMFGYSNDNKNVDGKLLTVYSSETTAHILDAIKEGAIQNVNDYTFGVYKLFPDLGSDYTTCISFMMQPGVTEIVNEYNNTNSIFAKTYGNPIDRAIRNIASKLGIEKSESQPIDYIEAKITKILNGTQADSRYVLDAINLKQRIDNTDIFSSPVERLLFDYKVIQQFKTLHNIASKITSLSMLCNPDKFGAKQTIFATNKIFDDIQEAVKIDAREQVFALDGNNRSFLERIYPGITRGLDGYISYNGEQSEYPSLNSFLKYATATSIKINRNLFKTQRPEFIQAVNTIKNIMSGNKPILTETTYNMFESYIINNLFNKVPILASNVRYVIGKGLETTISNTAEERRRIFGYGYNPSLNVQTETEEHPFVVKNTSSPTQDEIDEFSTFTPAQKVEWVNRNFRDSLICKYIKTNLFNDKKYRKNVAGMQTLEFSEDGVNREQMYYDFYNTFANTNPFLVMTAMDIIKYGFIAEGFNMKKISVNKVINNNILNNELGIEGTGIVESMDEVFAKFIDNIDRTELDTMCMNYVRGHSNMKEISQSWFNIKQAIKNHNINVTTKGIIIIDNNDYNKTFILNHKVGFIERVIIYDELGYTKLVSKLTLNKYINIKTKDSETLYKIIGSKNTDTIYLVPLNKLHENENSVWSANSDFHTYMPYDYYSTLIDEYEDNHLIFNLAEFSTAAKEKAVKEIDKYKKPEKETLYKSVTPIDFNINDNSNPTIEVIKKSITNHFDGTTSQPLYMENRFLGEHIVGIGVENGLTKFINGKEYRIFRVDTAPIFHYLTKKGLKKEIAPKDIPLAEFINKARQRGVDNGHPGEGRISNLMAIMPINSNEYTPDVMSSSITEAVRIVDKTIKKAAVNGDESARKYVRQQEENSHAINTDSTNTRLDSIIMSSAEYVSVTVDKLLNGEYGLNLFIKNPNTGLYVPITDESVLEKLKSDPILRRSYLKTILEANHLIDKFSSFATFKFTDDNQHLKYYVDKLNEAIRKLQESPLLKEAEEKYVTSYLAGISNNPNIKNDIISLLDGFHSTSFLTAEINDLQETSNPIIQIITSDVMRDVRAKEFQGTQRVREFKKFVNKLKEEAKKNGREINWSNIIDENGRFKQEYNQQFLDDLQAHRNAISDCYEDYKNATTEQDKYEAFNSYLQAKHRYNKWKLLHTNQELLDKYYKDEIELDETMMNSNGTFIPVYVEYKMLQDRLSNVLSHSLDGALDANWQKQRDELFSQIQNLKSTTYQIGYEFEIKQDYESYELSKDPNVRRKQLTNSYSAALTIDTYVNKRKELNDKYYEYKENFGFKEQLDKYRAIINKYRNVSDSVKDDIQEYQTAKTWIKKNAKIVYDFNKKDSSFGINEAIKTLEKAYDLGIAEIGSDEFTKQIRAAQMTLTGKKSLSRQIAKTADAFDEFGVIDGSKLSDEQIARLKEEQEVRYGLRENTAYSERGIIHNSTSDDTIYTAEFYEGMRSDGLSNPEYQKIVKQINDVLRQVHNPSTGVLNTASLTIDEINKVISLFEKLGYKRIEQTFDKSGIKKRKGVSRQRVKQIIDFINKNVEFALTEEDQARFNAERVKAAKVGGREYELAWLEMNTEWSESKQQFIPNHLLWGHARPKDNVKDKFIDKKRTAAIRILRKAFTIKTTKYYDQTLDAKAREFGYDSEAFNEWFDKNHVYNPNTHHYEPLPCWTTSEVNEGIKGTWEATYQASSKVPKTGMTNLSYEPKLGTAGNYKKLENDSYISNNYMTKEERELKDYIQTLLISIAKTEASKRYFKNGYLPAKSKHEDKSFSKVWLTELAKGFGYVEGNQGRERWNDTVNFDSDYIPDMPMLGQLRSKESIAKPERWQYADNIDGTNNYKKALEEWNKNADENKKKNADIHKKLLDNNWEEVISEFITKAAHYNAIQDNKLQLYMGQKLINDISIYQTRNSTIHKLKIDNNLSSDEETVYKKETDKHLQEQYTNWIRRLVFDQYKQNQGNKTRVMSIIQGITSTNYMTLNVRGGIANITVGESNIAGEKYAKEYFGMKDWLVGKSIWIKAAASFAANMYSETSTSLADAIVKGFNIVDYDELTGRVTQVNMEEWSKRLRDMAFSPQTIGEHFMQNSAMFSMMKSHRVIKTRDENTPYTIMNLSEYTRNASKIALESILTEEEKEKWKAHLDKIKENPNESKDYAWFKKDIVTQFMLDNFNKDRIDKFNKKKEEIVEQLTKEFEEQPDVYSQFKLGSDGKLDFADGSVFSQLNNINNGQEVSDAYNLMGMFKQRVISVNKKIHGNYGKLDSAKIESQWWGGLVMQYHKHIYPGIMKRYRIKGYFNEERGSIEKGSYIALYDFLTAPIKQIAKQKGLTEGQTETLTGIQNIFSMCTDYIHYLKLYNEVMPDYEKSNMRRCLGDLAGMVLAVGGALLLYMLAGGGDDDDQGFLYNLMLYEMDRLSSETYMWTPTGAYAEAKKLWSSPIAAQSIFSDALNIMGTTAGIILEGEDYDPYFRTGRYAGENKLQVYIERRIPYWRNYVALRDINEQNNYYKLGKNMLSIIPVKGIANDITGNK
uniref:RNA-dependent RNA polymerase n=1 Tax=Geladintestivirus 2 TaxID=3233134 RepID=A0AAU8MM03_9CAUD